MITNLVIAENTVLTTNAYAIPINPNQPRGMKANQPAEVFNTIAGPGGVQAPRNWYPEIVLTWPFLVKSNSDHAALLAAFEDRQYVLTGLDYYIGILAGDTKGDGFPFWPKTPTDKFIQIRIIEVQAAEQPVDNDLDEIRFNMIVVCKWMDAS